MKGYPEEFYGRAKIAVITVRDEEPLKEAAVLVAIELIKEHKIPAVVLLRDGIKLDPKVTEGMTEVTVLDYFTFKDAIISLVNYLNNKVLEPTDPLTAEAASDCLTDFLVQVGLESLLEKENSLEWVKRLKEL